ncbi:hypothetical protein ES707_18217 [subsurface metagenome]
MSKQKRHKLLYPPRYPRGDPRNFERMRTGSELGRMVQLYEKLAGTKRPGDRAGTSAAGTGLPF